MFACELQPGIRFQPVDCMASPGVHVTLVKHFNFAKHRKIGSKTIIALVKVVDLMAPSSSPDHRQIDVTDARYPSTKSIATMSVDPDDTFVAFPQTTESFSRDMIGESVDGAENGPLPGLPHNIFGYLEEPAIHSFVLESMRKSLVSPPLIHQIAKIGDAITSPLIPLLLTESNPYSLRLKQWLSCLNLSFGENDYCIDALRLWQVAASPTVCRRSVDICTTSLSGVRSEEHTSELQSQF